MICDRTQSIAAFLEEAAARKPTPGGGSAAALAGALSAAMGEMVIHYSVGRKDPSPHEGELREALVELTRARQLLLALMEEDQAAFSAFSNARKSAGSAGDRDATFAAALLACIRIPQAIGASGIAILELLARVAADANKLLMSDLKVSAELAIATVRCAAHNIRVNLTDVSDLNERDRLSRATDQMLAHAVTLIRKLI